MTVFELHGKIGNLSLGFYLEDDGNDKCPTFWVVARGLQILKEDKGWIAKDALEHMEFGDLNQYIISRFKKLCGDDLKFRFN